MRGRGMRKISVAVAVALFSGALSIAAPTPAGACGAAVTRQQVFRDMKGSGFETVTLRTLHLEVEPPKAGKIGSTAVIKVEVTRPAKEDPLGQGIPMEDRPYVEPAEGVIVGVGLHVGNVFLPGAAYTDAKGQAAVKIKLERYAPKGAWVDMSVYAWKIVQETQCATIQEDGYKQQPKIFKTS